MRTTLAIKEQLLKEAKILSGARTNKETVEIALDEFIRRKKAKKLLDLKGKVELAYTLDEFLEQRRKDVPHR
jgi:predicted metal-binding transcription factor (methanogenesis marker protein 9)